MNKFWVDYQGNNEGFWEHEWNKHGTRISTLYPKCYDGYQPQEEVVDYFQRTVDLFKSLDSYKFLAAEGILPSSTKTYTAVEIQHALGKTRQGVNATIGCSKGVFEQIFYDFNVGGSVLSGTDVPVQPPGEFPRWISASFCPETGIRYLPKNMASVAITKGGVLGGSRGSAVWLGIY